MNKDIVDMYACPFCQEKNDCGIRKQSPCWCVNTNIPSQLIDLVPEETKNKSCICENCIADYLKSPQDFIKQRKLMKTD